MRKRSLPGIGFLRRTAQHLLAAREANAAVEFALIVPFLLAMLVPLADLGAYVYENMQVQLAAQAGAEYAAQQAWNPTGIKNAILSAANLPAGANLTVTPDPFDAAHVTFCACVDGTSTFVQQWGPAPGSCPNPRPTCASGATAGVYYVLGATAEYTPIIGGKYSILGSQTLSAQTFVRVQ